MPTFAGLHFDLGQEGWPTDGILWRWALVRHMRHKFYEVDKSMANFKQRATAQLLTAHAGYLILAGLLIMLGAATIAEAQISMALANASRFCGLHAQANQAFLGHCIACWSGAADLLVASMLVASSVRLHLGQARVCARRF